MSEVLEEEKIVQKINADEGAEEGVGWKTCHGQK